MFPRRTLRLNGLHGLKPILRGLDSRVRGNDNRGATAAGLELLEEAEVVFCEVADVGDVVFSHGETFDSEGLTCPRIGASFRKPRTERASFWREHIRVSRG